ncbi:MAG: apolipoprotein N-acyltransferase, partial [Tepidisphaeraceae bacterium]
MTHQAEGLAASASFIQPTNHSLKADFIPPMRWYGRLGLVALSVVLLSLSFAPFGHFYLAWVAMAPWLMAVVSTRSFARAFLWGWLAGMMFFLVNLSYLAFVTVPGWLVLSAYLALFWAAAAAIVRGAPARRLLLSAAGVAAVWTSMEWLRGNVGPALPLLFIGHTQTPVLPLCQIADVTGVHGVTFTVVLANAMLALTLLTSTGRKKTWPAWAMGGVIIVMVIAYGGFRMSQASTFDGPTVLVVQPNDRDFRNKASLDKQREYIAYHLDRTQAALQQSKKIDLIVWSETTMPSLNPEPRERLRGTTLGNFLDQVHRAIRSVAARYDAGIVTGGYYVGGYAGETGREAPTEYRNAAYFYDRSGEQAGRYDKIHLMAFGEFIPFRTSAPWLYRLLLRLGANTEEYNLTPGEGESVNVFTLGGREGGDSTRFITQICFDDLDSRLIARSFRGSDGEKRASMIINLTNDGWFRWCGPQQ